MRHTTTESRAVDVVTDVTCDRCGQSMLSPLGDVYGVTVGGSGGYMSTGFADMQEVHADVCEECAVEWFESFKRNPLDAV